MDAKMMAVTINSNFSEDYGFPKGFVRAKERRGNLVLVIGGRDVEISSRGKSIGSGSSSGCWRIEHDPN